MTELVAGRLLVATPSLLDPNFYRTVVLLIDHDDEGTVGVVLNRPMDIPVGEYLDDWEPLAANPAVVFAGGPVQPEVAIAVARGQEELGDRSHLIVHDLQLVDLDLDPSHVALEEIRVFSGYAAWAPGQLEGEIAEGAWWVLDSESDDPFADELPGFWSRVLRRQGGRLAFFASLPDDPRLN